MIIKISMYLVKQLTKFNIFKKMDNEKLTDNVIFSVFFFISNVFFFGIAYIFHCIPQMIVILAVLNILRLLTGGFHAPSLDHCLAVSVPYISTLAIISKYVINYPDIFCFLSVLFGVYIIKKVPIMTEFNMNNKSKEWFQKEYTTVFLLLYTINYICMNLNVLFCDVISTSISVGIIGVSIMMFEVKDKSKREADKS